MSPPHTPTGPKRHEYDTIIRARFFNAFGRKQKYTSLGQICCRNDLNIPTSTARTWLRKRDELSSPILGRTRRRSSKLGRPIQASVQRLEPLLSPSHPSHHLYYDQMAEEEELLVSRDTLRKAFSSHLNTQRYKKPYSSSISAKNKQERV
jgi:hypothetical protein